MGRKCSHCGNNGHNSRTCSGYSRGMGSSGGAGVGLRLFGVQLDLDSPMKKSFSMECLCSPSSSSSPSSSLVSVDLNTDKSSKGYLSDGLIARTQERKKGVPWSEEEHRSFLVGLGRLGKGDWRGISRNFVTTRTPTQVASHAQKYFLRQSSLNKKKRRSSLFDMVRSDNRVAHTTECKIKSPSFSCEFPLIPELPSCYESSAHLIDLNSSSGQAGTESTSNETKQLQTTLSSSHYPVALAQESFDQLPAAAAASSLGSASQALIISPSLTKPAVPLEPLNLELSIAAPSSLNQTKASQKSLLVMARTSVF